MQVARQGMIRWFPAVAAALSLSLGAASADAQGYTPPTAPPPDWGPVSVNLEDLPYPYPVHFLEMENQGHKVRMAYMDVAPTGQANGRTVVLLHGMNFPAEVWGPTIDALAESGFRVIAPDQVGFGRSSKPVMHYSVNLMASNTKRLLDHLGIQRAGIVGHSMGGMLTSRFALHYPEVTTHAVMVNQIGLSDPHIERPWTDPEERYLSTLETSYQSILRNHSAYYPQWKEEYMKYVRIQYGWTLSGAWPQMARVRAAHGQMLYEDPVVNDWPHIQAKTLVIGGADDRLTDDYAGQARNVAETIPNADLILYPGIGHNPQLEIPTQFHTDLIRFLRSAPLAPSVRN